MNKSLHSVYIRKEMVYPCPNFNGATIEVWEWIRNFKPRFTEHVITRAIKMAPCGIDDVTLFQYV